MELFIDTAEIDEIKSLNITGLIDGVTTNPSLIAKSGRNIIETIEEICNEVSGPVSAEVTATDFETMIKEGRKLSAIAQNVAIKVPLTFDGLRACKVFSDDGIMVNVTLCFNSAQAILAVKAGADAVVLDGMQGGTAATQDVFIEHVGQPTLAIIRPAVQALQDLGMHRKVQLILSGGIRSGADVAKAMALGADAVAIGSAALIALGDNDPKWESEYNKLGSTAGAYDDWHEGKDPAGITTQDPELMKRFDPIEGGRRLRNYLKVMTLEAQTIARACGKNHMHNLEPEDLVALTMEAAAMAQVPLSGTNWWPGKSGSNF